MDIGLTFRPVPSAPQAGTARYESVSLPQAEPTEIAPYRAVLASDPTTRVLPQPNTTTRPADKAPTVPDRSTYLDTEVLVDSQSKDLIYRTIDTRTRQVVRQLPDQALLRLRAYARAVENGESVTEALIHTDLIA